MILDDLKHKILGRLDSLEYCVSRIVNAETDELKNRYLNLLHSQFPIMINEIRNSLQDNHEE